MSTSGKFKIGIVNSYYYPDTVGGAEVVVKILAETYKEMGSEVFVVSSGQKDTIETVNGIKVYRLKNRNLYWGKEASSRKNMLKPLWHLINVNNPFIIKAFERIMQIERPDIVHTNNLNDISFGIIRVIKDMGIKIIHTIHDYSFMCLKGTMFKNMKNCESICTPCLLYAQLKKKYSEMIDIPVGVSQFVINRHQKHGFFSKASNVIYNPVFLDRPKNRITKNFKNPTFGFMGRLHPSKGIELLIKTFNYLQIPLLIAGKAVDEKYDKFLKNMVQSPKIKFLGWQNPSDFYRKIDVLIIPSLWHDPSPTVVHEANSFGIPVIASNRGGLPELVKNNKTGLIFNPESPESLASTIMSLTEEKLQAFSQNAFDHAKEFTPEKVAARYLKLMGN